jgi:hypothetical protein
MSDLTRESLELMREFFPYFWLLLYYLDMRVILLSLKNAIEKLCQQNES